MRAGDSPPEGSTGGSPPMHKRMSLRRPASVTSLFTITQTSTNCFQRRPPRPTHHRVEPAQSVAAPSFPLPSLRTNEEEEAEAVQADIQHPVRGDSDCLSVPEEAVHTSSPSTCPSISSREEDSDSEYSDHDLWNSAMQSYLLDSDDDDDENDGDARALSYTTSSLGDQLTASPFLVANVSSYAQRIRRDVPARKLTAKKASRSGLSSAARMTPSNSSQSLDSQAFAAAASRSRTSSKLNKKKNQMHRFLLAPLHGDKLADGRVMGPLTIVLDIDETLVSARGERIDVRPHVKDLLDLCATLCCEVIVWTAGVADYVNPILRQISVACGRTDWYHHVISRHRRWYSEDKDCCKDLTLLNRPLDRVLLVENNPVSVMKQPKQAILVEDYLGANDADETLRHLASIVRRLVFTMSSSRTPTSTPPLGPLELHPNPVPMRSVSSVLPREAAVVPVQFLLYEVMQHSVDHTGPPPDNFEKLSCFTLRYSTASTGGQHSYGGIVPLM